MNTEKCPGGPLQRIVGRLRDAITDYDGSQIADAAQPLDWLTAGDIRRALDEIERLQADAARGKYMLRNAEWFRFDNRTHLAVRVPDGSDLGCEPMRERALDAAMNPDQPPNAALSGPHEGTSE